MSYRVRLSCDDCTGADPIGCFDGGTELLESDDPPYDVLTFTALRDAVRAGEQAAPNAPLSFTVEYADGDREGEEVEIDEMTYAEIEAFV